MIRVTQEQFHKVANRRNAQVFAHRNHCTWTTSSGVEIGRSTPGYMPETVGQKTEYFLYQAEAEQEVAA